MHHAWHHGINHSRARPNIGCAAVLIDDGMIFGSISANCEDYLEVAMTIRDVFGDIIGICEKRSGDDAITMMFAALLRGQNLTDKHDPPLRAASISFILKTSFVLASTCPTDARKSARRLISTPPYLNIHANTPTNIGELVLFTLPGTNPSSPDKNA